MCTLCHGTRLSRWVPLLDGIGAGVRRCACPNQKVLYVRGKDKGSFSGGGGRTRLGCFGLRLLLGVDSRGLLVALLLQ